MQMDYEKRIRDVEKQRGQLLEEMDSREGELLRRVDGLEDDKRVLERNLKKSVSERDHYNELNTILSSENDRCFSSNFVVYCSYISVYKSSFIKYFDDKAKIKIAFTLFFVLQIEERDGLSKRRNAVSASQWT